MKECCLFIFPSACGIFDKNYLKVRISNLIAITYPSFLPLFPHLELILHIFAPGMFAFCVMLSCAISYRDANRYHSSLWLASCCLSHPWHGLTPTPHRFSHLAVCPDRAGPVPLPHFPLWPALHLNRRSREIASYPGVDFPCACKLLCIDTLSGWDRHVSLCLPSGVGRGCLN